MPIFISYSHADKDFVDRLAAQLVVHKVHVWLDRWEIHVGDSLLTKVQEAITGASALLVILSMASVKSEWFRKELNSGLMRELEEKRVVVLPVLKEKCTIPLFLKEKMYADFTKDFDDGLHTILESVARVTNDQMGRLEEPKWHTDWSLDTGDVNGRAVFRVTMVETPQDQPYVVFGLVTMIADPDVHKWYVEHLKKGTDHLVRRDVLVGLAGAAEKQPVTVVMLEDQFPARMMYMVSLKQGDLMATIEVRRLGTDTGRNVLFRIAQQLRGIAECIQQVTRQKSDGGFFRKRATKSAKRVPKKTSKKLQTKKASKRKKK